MGKVYLRVPPHRSTPAIFRAGGPVVGGLPHAVAGAGDRHNRLVVNLVLVLGPLARKKGCRLYASDMRLRVDAATVYYPDLMVVCEEDPGEYYKKKPCLVIEVLSESTYGL